MIKKSTYISPECEYDLFRDASLLCASADLEPLVEDTETIDWV